jgi:hypothetical protein
MRLTAGGAGAARSPKAIMSDIPTPDRVALARRLYLEGVPVRTILATTGIPSLGTLYRCVQGAFPDGTGVAPAPLPRRRADVRIRGRAGSRAALVARMWRAAERQVEEIEQRLTATGLQVAERESNARTLAIVVKTMRELAAFDEKAARGKEAKQDDDDDPVPADIDEFRRELARRMDALVASRTGAGVTHERKTEVD